MDETTTLVEAMNDIAPDAKNKPFTRGVILLMGEDEILTIRLNMPREAIKIFLKCYINDEPFQTGNA